MATKIIKFNDGTNTYVPVTVASAVQYSYENGVMSVQDAIGTIASTVVSSNNSVSTVISNLSKDVSNHKSSKDYLSYDSTDGLKLSGTHGAGNVKMVPGTGVSFAYTGGALTISSPNSHASGSDNQHLSASNSGSNGAMIELDDGGGKVNLEGYGTYTAASSYAHVGISYEDSALRIKVSYTDTNTVFKGSADASGTTTATAPSEKNGMIGVIQKVKSTNGTSFNETTYVAVPSKEYVDNYVDDAVNVALTSVLKYKGTLGTGGTITTLPTATSANVGHVYVVKTAGEYANVDVNIDGTNETISSKKSLEAGDYVIGTWNGSAYVWSAVNGENQVDDKAATLTVSYTGAASAATIIATVDGTNITLKTQHAAVTTNTTQPDEIVPGHDSSFMVIGDVVVSNGHVTTLQKQKVVLPSETQLSKTGTNKTAKLTHGGTFTYISNLNVSNHEITYDYTTATLPSQDHTKSGSISAGQLTYWNDATTHTAVTNSYGNSSTQYVYVEKGILKVGTLPTGNKEGKNIVGASSTATANANANAGSTYLNHIEGGVVKSAHKITGSGGISVTATDTGATISVNHSTAAGFKHIPTGGTDNQVLKYSASGTAVWGSLSEGLKYDIYGSTDDFTLDLGTSTATVSIAKTTF